MRTVGMAVLMMACGLAAARGAEEPIADNSFLIEEAYNQEAGVVQHISVLQLPEEGGGWSFDFTQEWPLGGVRHQLSYTVPWVEAGAASGLGDVLVNYRVQLVGDAAARLAVAPRASLMLPTGDSDEGLGSDAYGLELNLPISYYLSDHLVAHWNVGGSFTPGARDASGAEADLDAVFAGQGLVWLLRPSFNLLLEARWERAASVVGEDLTARAEELLLSPGARLAQNFDSGLQIVYGLAFPLEVGAGDGDRSALLYLSLEHPFGKP